MSVKEQKQEKQQKRCQWCLGDELMMEYHDNEWGVPVHDDNLHFEYLILDAAQAGLSWRTVLYKRENYRKAFVGFDPAKVARFTENRIAKLLENPGIIRNRQKVNSAIVNARAFLAVQEEFGSFDEYIWRFVDGATIVNRWKNESQIPAKTDVSEAMSKDMKQRGFSFCGPTICYAYMQAAGLVNDHEISCFCYNTPGAKK